MNKHKIILSLLFFLAPLLLKAADVRPAEVTKQVKAAVTANSEETGYLNEYTGVQTPKAIPPEGIFPTIVRLLFALLICISLIYLLAWALKYFNIKASIPIKSENVVNVIAKEYIDAKTVLYVVDFAGKVLLLGNAGSTLNVLTEITDKQTIEELKQKADEYLSKYRLKTETRFDQQLKSTYLQQGKKMINNGNDMIKGIMDKFVKKDKK